MYKRVIKGSIIFLSIVIIFIVLFFVALEFGQKQLVKTIHAIEGVSVEKIEIHLFKAQVKLKNVSVTMPTYRFEAARLTITLSIGEMVDLVVREQKELSKVSISLLDAMLKVDGVEGYVQNLEVEMKGYLSFAHLEDSRIYTIKGKAQHAFASQPHVGLSYKTKVLHLLAVGEVDMNLDITSVDNLIQAIDIVNITLEHPEFLFVKERVGGIPLLNANSAWLQDENNFKGTFVQAHLSRDKKAIKGEDIVVDFPIISIKGTCSFQPNGPFNIRAIVTHLDDRVVKELNPILILFGYSIPKEPFTLDVDYSYGERPLLIEMNPFTQ